MKTFCLPRHLTISFQSPLLSLFFVSAISGLTFTIYMPFLVRLWTDHGSFGKHKERKKKLFSAGRSIFWPQLKRAMERNGFFQMKRETSFRKGAICYNRCFRSPSYRSTSTMRHDPFRMPRNGNVQLQNVRNAWSILTDKWSRWTCNLKS